MTPSPWTPFFRLDIWLLVNLMMREQTPITGFTTLTRRSRASTFQTVSPRLSTNHTRVTFASDTSFPRHTSTSCHLVAQRVWRHSVSVFVHDRYSHAGKCTGFPSNIGLFLSTGNKYLFLLQCHLMWECICAGFRHTQNQDLRVILIAFAGKGS